MNIFVTGSTGFVGLNLAEYFVKKGYSVLQPSFEELDLTDTFQVEEYFKEQDIDIILHAATTLRNGTDYPAKTCENNLRMFFNLHRCLKPKMKFINLGTGSEYDRRVWHKKMPETFFDQSVPQDDHSYSKYLVSKYLLDTKPANVLNLRIFGIYGKFEDYRFKFISNAIVKNILKQPIVINQNVVYDYIWIEDFCRIVEFFVKNETEEKVFNVAPTDSIDLIALAKLINEVSDFRSEIKVLNPGIGVEYSGDNTRLLSVLGGFDFTSHRQAISELYRLYRDIQETLDDKAVKQDAYLNYAKKLRDNYFVKNLSL